jgi:hypothetical protein
MFQSAKGRDCSLNDLRGRMQVSSWNGICQLSYQTKRNIPGRITHPLLREILLGTFRAQPRRGYLPERPPGWGFVGLCPYGGSLHKNEPIIGGRSSEVSFLFQRIQAITITNIVIDDKFFDFITIYALRGKVFASYNPLESINNLLKSTLNYIWHSNGISNVG